MTTDAILLLGRDTGTARDVLATHADRLATRTDADHVRIATYESEPTHELADELATIDADDVYAVPMVTAHSHDTLDRLPGALTHVPGDVHYCEPVGQSPAITDVIADRATAALPDTQDNSLVLVAFGSSTKPYHRQTTNYHAARLRETTDYDEVLTCYVLQNPTVECVRYNVANDRAVATPLFIASDETTTDRIPDALELDRTEMAYAAPLGTHERVTDAIHGEVAKQRALAADQPTPRSLEAGLSSTQRPVVTDGDGGRR